MGKAIDVSHNMWINELIEGGLLGLALIMIIGSRKAFNQSFSKNR